MRMPGCGLVALLAALGVAGMACHMTQPAQRYALMPTIGGHSFRIGGEVHEAPSRVSISNRYIQPAEPVYQVQPPRPVCGASE